MQHGIIDLLLYIIEDLNFVPLKELAVISLYFQSSCSAQRDLHTLVLTLTFLGSSSGMLLGLICRRFTDFLRKQPKFLTVVRESGFINVMSLMLSDLTENLQRDKDSIREKHKQFMEQALRNFDVIADSMVEMLKDPANVAIFQRT